MTLIRFAKQQQEQNMGKNQTQTTLRQGETTIKVRKEISTLIVLKIGEEKETPIVSQKHLQSEVIKSSELHIKKWFLHQDLSPSGG